MHRRPRRPRGPTASARRFRAWCAPFALFALAVAAWGCGRAPRVAPLSATAPPEPPPPPAEAAGDAGDAECLAGLASPEVTPVQAVEVLFLRPSERTAWLASCRGAKGGPIACLLEARYGGDAGSLKTALALYGRTGSVAGPEDEHWVERRDGERAHLLPALPVGAARKQLDRVAGALFGLNDFLSEVARLGGRSPRFRATGLRVRFFRPEGPADAEVYTSEGQIGVPVEVAFAPRVLRPRARRAPNAGAAADRVALRQAPPAAPRAAAARVSRDDIVRALARLNDGEHGGWAARALEAPYRAIVERCGGDARCLARFDPRPPGGPARPALFRAGGDASEYGVEIILRYFYEQKAALARKRPAPPAFKCAAPENAAAWSLVADEFFAGFDRGPACP